ncbi:unnamed protein product [Aphanomyces euteiches]
MLTIPKTMRAVGFHEPLPIDDPCYLLDLVVDVPTASGRELLIQVKANAVNPIDYKKRREPVHFTSPEDRTEPRVLGFDASGVVVASIFAGPIFGLGSNAEYQAVDERVVGHKPSSLSFGEASGLPLTVLTAYETIFHQLDIPKKDPSVNKPASQSVLVLNGAGGVGSIAIQLLKEMTDLTVIATASRHQSSAWLTELGADYVVNHAEDIPKQLAAIGHPHVDYILAYTELAPHFDAIAEVIKPRGKICAISPNDDNIPIQKLFLKSAGFYWLALGTRSIFNTGDLDEHHRILDEVSALVDAKRIRSIVGKDLGIMNAENLKKAHAPLEGGHVIGKLVLTGF